MKYFKLFKEYKDYSGFLSGGQTSAGHQPNTAGVASNTAAGATGKTAQKAGPEATGPQVKNYEKVLKTMKEPILKRKKKRVSRNQDDEKLDTRDITDAI